MFGAENRRKAAELDALKAELEERFVAPVTDVPMDRRPVTSPNIAAFPHPCGSFRCPPPLRSSLFYPWPHRLRQGEQWKARTGKLDFGFKKVKSELMDAKERLRQVKEARRTAGALVETSPV